MAWLQLNSFKIQLGSRKVSCNLGLLALKVALLFYIYSFLNTNTVQNQRDILGYWNSSLGGGFAEYELPLDFN